MKNKFYLYLVMSLLWGCGATKNMPLAGNAPIIASLDLLHVENDRVKVTVDPGMFKEGQMVFRIPKTVPGTYSTDDYGQYVDSLAAWDHKGGRLPVQRLDVNSWSIANATSLDKVTYWVNDTYDSEYAKEDPVFSPAGTNILDNTNFVLNLHAFVGYFDGYKEVPYELHIAKPNNLGATTSLVKANADQNEGKDVFTATRYFEVVDNPIFYAPENSIGFQVKDITVNMAVYSPNGQYTAADLKPRMEEMMSAQKAFLGDIDSTKEYNILLYLSEMNQEDAKGFGALEHHTSTVVVLPESLPKGRMEEAMVDVVSHEFFHIVTPLNVHSKEVQYFDYNDPKMSKHLWMYEGTTEYFANLFQVQQGLITPGDFYKRLMDKVGNAKTYDDTMSFTQMSQHILEPPYEENYANVYEKGALINMALDILLREKSNGEKGVLWLMKELSKKYGKDTPFNDDDLIPEIVAMTYPEVGTFFADHVQGNIPLDYGLYWRKVGLGTEEIERETGYFLDGDIPYIDVDEANGNAIFVREGISLNSFFTGLGAKGGDVIKAIDDRPVTLESVRGFIGQSFGWSPDRAIKMEVERQGERIVLEAPAGTPVVIEDRLMELPGATEAQIGLRNAWLKG